jgi:hypothetical protein
LLMLAGLGLERSFRQGYPYGTLHHLFFAPYLNHPFFSQLTSLDASASASCKLPFSVAGKHETVSLPPPFSMLMCDAQHCHYHPHTEARSNNMPQVHSQTFLLCKEIDTPMSCAVSISVPSSSNFIYMLHY